MALSSNNNINAFLIRLRTGDQGSEGIFCTPGFTCKTMELPWRNNQISVSCIPPGQYKAIYHESPKYGYVYMVEDVPGRTWILTHWGNWAGDRSKGFKSNSDGCILLGKYHADIHNQRAVALSKVTFRRYMAFMAQAKEFNLTIGEIYHD